MVRGFTLIELLVSISILVILVTLGIASFGIYNKQQILNNTTLDVKTMLQTARSKALAQVNPNNQCAAGLTGYEFLVCCSGVGCQTCQSSKDYEVDAICNNSQILVDSKKLPAGYSFSGTKYFIFNTLRGIVTNPGQLTINANGTTKTITVTSLGGIQ